MQEKKKLNRDDANAVDLLLDGQAVNLSDSGMFVKAVDVDPMRVRTVRQVMDLLKEMPVEEPPADLVSRTLQRVEALAARSGILRPSSAPRIGDHRPHA